MQLQNFDREILQDLLQVRSTVKELHENRKFTLPRDNQRSSSSSTSLEDSPSERTISSVSLHRRNRELPNRLLLSPSPEGERECDIEAPAHLKAKDDERLLQDFFGEEQFGKFKQTFIADETEESGAVGQHSAPLTEREEEEPHHLPLTIELKHSPKLSPSHSRSPSLNTPPPRSHRISNGPLSDVGREMQELRFRLQAEAKKQLDDLDLQFSPRLSLVTNSSRLGSLDVSTPEHSREGSSDSGPTVSNHSHQGSQELVRTRQTGHSRSGSKDLSLPPQHAGHRRQKSQDLARGGQLGSHSPTVSQEIADPVIPVSHSRQGSGDVGQGNQPTGYSRDMTANAHRSGHSRQGSRDLRKLGAPVQIPPAGGHLRLGSVDISHTSQAPLRGGHVRYGSYDASHTSQAPPAGGHLRFGSFDMNHASQVPAPARHSHMGSLDTSHTSQTGHVRQTNFDLYRPQPLAHSQSATSNAVRGVRGHARQGSLDNMPFPVFSSGARQSPSPSNAAPPTDRQKSPSPSRMAATHYDSYSLERTRHSSSRSPTPPLLQYAHEHVRQGSAGSNSSGASGTLSPPPFLPPQPAALTHHPLQQQATTGRSSPTSVARQVISPSPLARQAAPPPQQTQSLPQAHVGPRLPSTDPAGSSSHKPPAPKPKPKPRPKSSHDINRRVSGPEKGNRTTPKSLSSASGCATVPKSFQTGSTSSGTHYSTTVIKGMRKRNSDGKLPSVRSLERVSSGGEVGNGQVRSPEHLYDRLTPTGSTPSPELNEPETKNLPKPYQSQPHLSQAPSTRNTTSSSPSVHQHHVSSQQPNTTPQPQSSSSQPQPYQLPSRVLPSKNDASTANGSPHIHPEEIQPYVTSSELRKEMPFQYKPFINAGRPQVARAHPVVHNKPKSPALHPREQTWC